MKKSRIIRLIITAALTLLVAFSCAPLWAQADEVSAEVASLKGTVTVKRAASEKSFAAFAGLKLKQGDVVTTAPGGEIVVNIGADKTVKALSDSSFKISNLSGTDAASEAGFTLIKGAVFNEVRSPQSSTEGMTVRTGNTVAWVRGTTYTVSLRTLDGFTVHTLEGSVFLDTVLARLEQDANASLVTEQQTVVAGQGANTNRSGVYELTMADFTYTELEYITQHPESFPPDMVSEAQIVLDNWVEATPPAEWPTLIIYGPAPPPQENGSGNGGGGGGTTVTGVSIRPATASVAQGGTQQFTATVTGTGSQAQTVTWTIDGTPSSGTGISTSGLLTVGTNETATTLTVRATSTADTSKSGTAVVTVSTASPAGDYDATSVFNNLSGSGPITLTAADFGGNTAIQIPTGRTATIPAILGGITLSGVTLTVNGKLTNDGDLTVASNASIKNVSSTSFINNGTLDIEGSFINSGNGKLVNEGTININNGGNFTMSGGTFVNGGSIDNDGAFNLSGGTLANKGAINNQNSSSTFTMNGGTIFNGDSNGSFTSASINNDGSFNLSGGTITMYSDNYGGLFNDGIFIMSGSSVINVGYRLNNDTGTFTMNGGTINIDEGGGLANDNTFVINSGGSLYNMSGGVITNRALLTVSGSMENNGWLGLAAGSTFNINAGGTLTGHIGARINVDSSATVSGVQFYNANISNVLISTTTPAAGVYAYYADSNYGITGTQNSWIYIQRQRQGGNIARLNLTGTFGFQQQHDP